MSGLHFDFTGNPSGLVDAANKSRVAIQGITDEAERAGMSIDNFLGATKGFVTSFAGISVGAAGLSSFAKQVVNVRSEFQNTEAMFKVFLRDGEKAAAFMDEIQSYAFNNVFDFGDLTKQAAQLMAYGTAQENVIDRLDRLSNVAAGANVPLAELVSTYNKAKATDTVDSEMLSSLSAKGIRVREILAEIRSEQTGENVTERDLQGITLKFEDLETVLKRVTDEGGKYYGMMTEKMKTLGDAVGLLEDRIMGMFNDMGKQAQEPLREIIYGAADVVENWQEVIKILAGVAAAYGTVKAVIAMEKAWNNAQNVYAMQVEQETAQELTETISAYQKQLLKAEVAELQAAKTKGSITAAEEAQLLQKEAELELLESRETLQSAVDKGKMTQATADYIQSLREEISLRELKLTTDKESIETEIAGYESKIRSLTEQKASTDDMISKYEDMMNSAQSLDEVEKLRLASTRQQTLQTQSATIATELNTIEKQKAAAQSRLNTVNQGLETIATQKDTLATNANSASKRVATLVSKQLSASFKALTASMMTNPLGWIAGAIAGLVSLVMWIKRNNDAHDYAGKVAEATAEAQGKAAASASREQRELSNLVASIKVAKQHNEDYTDAKERLISQFGKYDSNLRKELEDINNLDSAYKSLSEAIMHSANVRAYQNYTKETQNQIDTEVENIWKSIQGTLNENVDNGKINEEESGQLLAELQRLLNGNLEEVEQYYDKYGTYYVALRQLMYEKGADGSYDILKKLTGEYDMAEDISDFTKNVLAMQKGLTEAGKLFGVAEDEMVSDEEKEQQRLTDLVKGKSYDELVKLVENTERKLAEARTKYRETGDMNAAQDVQRYENERKKISAAIQLQTGKSWTDAEKMAEERAKQIEKLALEETKIQNKAIKEQRAARKADYDLTIQEIRNEEAEYKRTHNGRGSGTLTQKLKNAKLQFDLDMAYLDSQWNEWKRNHDNETIKLQLDIEMEELQRAIDNAGSYDERNVAKMSLRNKEDERMVLDNREQADNEIKSKLGGSIESLDKYTQNKGKSDAELADILGIDEETVTQLRQIEEHYANILTLQQAQKAGQRGQEDMHQQVSDLQTYMSNAMQITSDYENRLEEIRQKYNISDAVDMHTATIPVAAAQERNLAKNIRDSKMLKNGEDNGVMSPDGDISSILQKINDITINMADMTTEEIVTMYQQVLDELNTKIGDKDMQISTNQDILETGQEFNAKTGEMEDITPERRLEIEQEQNNLLAERKVMTQMQTELQAKANEAAQNSLSAQQMRIQQFQDTSTHLISGFASLNQSAKTISETFGNVMSKNGKKAMAAIEGISEAAGNSLSAIKDIIPSLISMFTTVGTTGTAIQTEEAAVSVGTSTAIEGTSTAAATAIRTVESASVILAIISVALQVIQQIISVAMEFSASQKMQDAIDDCIDKVGGLKREQEKLNDAYKDESGSAYYKGMSNAAKNYYKLILAQEKTVSDARALYMRQATKYGEDSDKAKEAKDQYNEQLDALDEFKQEQKEIFDEMAQDLLTTDLSSFCESLAEQYIEGFANGMDGINDVFDNIMKDLQKNMMKKGLQIALENLFSETWEKIKELTEDGDLTTAEMDAILAEMDAKSEQSKQIAEQYYQSMSERGLLDDADVETSSGGFSSMTQDQADTLSARFTALQISGANVESTTRAMLAVMEQLGISDTVRTSILGQITSQFTLANEIALNQLDELRKITDNTSTLADTNRRLRTIEENTNSLRE